MAVHDETTAGVYISPGKHGRQIMEKYWAKGQDCPVAISSGHDPMLLLVGGLEIPHGVSEFEVAGGLSGRPVDVIQSDLTGLPIPATAEIVIEGRIPAGEMRDEGPFGEWLGYCASGRKPTSIVKIDAIRHRNDPIILGMLPAIPPNDNSVPTARFCVPRWSGNSSSSLASKVSRVYGRTRPAAAACC